MLRGYFDDHHPLWWTLMVIPGYTLWGAGLLVAAVSYLTLTRPACTRAAALVKGRIPC